MESLDLNTLSSSLPNANLANAEEELSNNFKAAALSITTLYRSSRQTSKRAYNAGYAAACKDLLLMIQQGVSVGGSSLSDGMTIGRVMDWIEARLDAVKSREEEEEEEEEREKGHGGTRHRPASGTSKGKEAPVPSNTPRPNQTSIVPTKQDSSLRPASTTNDSPEAPSSQLPSPSPPPRTPLSLRPIQPLPQGPLRPSRLRPNLNSRSHPFPTSTSDATYAFASPPILLPSSDAHAHVPPMAIADLAAGAKRRHAAMMYDSPASTPPSPMPAPQADGSATHATGNGTARRRTRSSRSSQNQNHCQADSMDIDEDGVRERKRVARR